MNDRRPDDAVEKRRSSAPACVAWLPFLVRAVQIYCRHELSAGGGARAVTPEMFRAIPRAAGNLPLLRDRVRGRRADRQRPARQRAADLPVEAAARGSNTSPGKLAVLVFYLLLVTLVPAVLLVLVQMMFSGSFDFLLANLHLFPAITVFAVIRVVVCAVTMLALSSLSKSSRYVASCTPA